MNYTDEAWEEEQMSNLGCESVSDLIAEVKRLRELKIAEEDELEKLCNRAEYYEGEYNLTRRAKQELLVEVKRLRDGIQHWFDTVAHREDDVMVQYFKRLIE
tara:strand:- start:20 stop:325 length:306 start_codon:yes stop_codon:yes gene_type:complete